MSNIMSRDISQISEAQCLFCYSPDLDILGLHREFNSHIVICNRCGLIQTSPIPSNYQLEDYYHRNFRAERTDQTLNRIYLKQQATLANSQYNFVSSSIPKNDFHRCRILEIGCSVGCLLNVFRSAGADVMGFEPDEKNAHFAIRNGLNVIQSFFNPMLIRRQSLDGVLLSHVFEHLTDPMGTLRSIFSLLKPSGFLFIEVPNESINRVLLRIEAKGTSAHLIFLTKKNLLDIVASCSFELVKCVSWGQSTTYLDHYLRNLAHLKRRRILHPNFYRSILFFCKERGGKYVRREHPDLYSNPRFLRNYDEGDSLIALRGLWIRPNHSRLGEAKQ